MCAVNDTAKLSAVSIDDPETLHLVLHYPLINRDQDASLCVFRGQYVAVDSHSPPLIPPDLDVTVHTINKRCELGPKEKDVDSAEFRYLIEGFSHSLFKGPDVQIGNHVPVNVHSGATLID